jgi:hypothetical protein
VEDTTEERYPALWDTTEKNLFAILTVFRCIPQRKKSSSVVSHNGGKPSPLYPTAEKNSSVISHNGKKPVPLYPTTAKKPLT